MRVFAGTPPAARRRLGNESGAVAVEFGLLVPVLVALVFGIINFGIVFGQNLALNNASRDAARFAVVRQIDGSTADRSCYDTLDRARNASSVSAFPLRRWV